MINLLFAIDDRMTAQLLTTLYSIVVNTPQKQFTVYVIQKEVLSATPQIEAFCAQMGLRYRPLVVGATFVATAPVTERYPETIYYRLLAQRYLPESVTRILYLDVDILVLNDLTPLYECDLGTDLYAAASHNALSRNSFNQLRLGNYEAESYFNSGVLLYNLPAVRAQVKVVAIADYIQTKKMALFLPDQDILNGLYGHQIQKIPDELYNFDARRSRFYYALSSGQWDLDWVITNTVILHFCGRDKPWKKDYHNRYAGLYKHYALRAQRVLKRSDHDDQSSPIN